jgi:2-polyprenyl-3-methyl-5-hydroxy-6-metoxy-1,4-benzoquinol methylase
MIGTPLADSQGYIARMSAGLHDKLRVGRYLPPNARDVLDVGCADGALTLALAARHPQARWLGIDLDDGFIGQAEHHRVAADVPNAAFRTVYLRSLLGEERRFDVVIFASVLHEFWTYGQGISSVLKALADAHELLRPGGVVVIRDMVLDAYAAHATWRVDAMRAAILGSPFAPILASFEDYWGTVRTLHDLNHFLLKYPYQTNWKRELVEHYVPVTAEQYMQMFALLGMTVQTHDLSLLPYLRAKWQQELGLVDDDLALLRSTALFVAQKHANPHAAAGE